MKVLYATDGFPAAIAAGHAISSLFRRDVVSITAISVTHEGSLDPGHIVLELDPVEGRREDSLELASSAADRFRAEGFDAESKVLEGHPGRELLRETTEGPYDLVVVGSESHSWVGNHLLGSVSTLLLHEAPCSILVVHEFDEDADGRRAVLAVDGSDAAERTVSMLSGLLDPTRVEVEVISVVGVHLPTVAPVLTGAPFPTSETFVRMDVEVRTRAESCVELAKRTLQDAGFAVSTRVEQGGATTVILDEAKQVKADLVAVGTRGLGPIRRALLGSVSDQVARHARAAFIGRVGKEMR